MDASKLKEVLELHAKWLRGESGGQRASLHYANLRGASLRGASLRGADLRRASLHYANLRGASLRGASLRGADLRRASLRRASLIGADLRGADLRGADLRRADLRGADLREADLYGANLPHFQIPQEGDLTVWKKLSRGRIAKLRIPGTAKRTATPIGRKCRAEFAWVVEIVSLDGEKLLESMGMHSKTLLYRVGEIVHPDKYDPDIRVECTHGIHFFLTREEAEEY